MKWVGLLSLLWFPPEVVAAERVLTNSPHGHQIHHAQVFSRDGRKIVFDYRNDETQLGQSARIGLVDVATGEESVVYEAPNASAAGPGVGAATFSPVADEVVFIHGLENASEERPYAATRRTAALVSLENPGRAERLDARDITPPFTPGALRGGTHAHGWAADGKWLSFTYNDAVVSTGPPPGDLRTVGVIIRDQPVAVTGDTSAENFPGRGFTVLVVPVTAEPKPGSDEISRAYDEGWVGTNGYLKRDGSRKRRAIAFLGNVASEDGTSHSDVFIADLPSDLTRPGDGPLEGTATAMPSPPTGVEIRRLTRTGATAQPGMQGPRHWVQASPNGATIAFLDAADDGLIQIFGVSPNGGAMRQISRLEASVETPIQWSPDGRSLACAAGGRVVLVDAASGAVTFLTEASKPGEEPCNGVVFSPDGSQIAFNRKLPHADGGRYFQICLVPVQRTSSTR